MSRTDHTPEQWRSARRILETYGETEVRMALVEANVDRFLASAPAGLPDAYQEEVAERFEQEIFEAELETAAQLPELEEWLADRRAEDADRTYNVERVS